MAAELRSSAKNHAKEHAPRLLNTLHWPLLPMLQLALLLHQAQWTQDAYMTALAACCSARVAKRRRSVARMFSTMGVTVLASGASTSGTCSQKQLSAVVIIAPCNPRTILFNNHSKPACRNAPLQSVLDWLCQVARRRRPLRTSSVLRASLHASSVQGPQSCLYTRHAICSRKTSTAPRRRW